MREDRKIKGKNIIGAAKEIEGFSDWLGAIAIK
jgi:hypothetical protein